MFKQMIIGSGFLIACASTSADTVLGVDAGIGQWQSDYSGEVGSVSASLDDLNLTEENNNHFFVALEHPIPLLPNILVQKLSLDTSAASTLDSEFVFDDIAFPSGTAVVTQLDLSHTDAVLYYEVLDNWISLDLGLNLRMFDGSASISASETNLTEHVELDAVVPMAYGKAQFELPLTGWSVLAAANVVAYDDNEISDYSAAVSYRSDMLVVFDLGIEVGYRSMSLQLEEDLNTDIELEGPYASLTVHF